MTADTKHVLFPFLCKFVLSRLYKLSMTILKSQRKTSTVYSNVKCGIPWPLGWDTLGPAMFMATRIRSGVSWFWWPSDMDSRTRHSCRALRPALFEPQGVVPTDSNPLQKGLVYCLAPEAPLFQECRQDPTYFWEC